MRIHIEDGAFAELKTALENAGENYKQNLVKLTNLINVITSGDIQGDPATDLLNKFREKQDAFNALAEEIDKAERYVGIQQVGFSEMISELKEKAE